MTSKNQVQAKFLILRKIKYSEADLIIHALSTQGGRFSFIAKSALKSKKRFGGGVLEASHFVSLTYKDNGEGRMKVLNEASLVDEFKGLRDSYDRIELAMHVLECILKISLEGDEHSEALFNLTGHTLRAISKSENLQILKMHFYLKLLFQQGVLTAEPWMNPFLSKNLSESEQLLDQKKTVEQYDSILSLSVREYLQRAETDFFSPNG